MAEKKFSDFPTVVGKAKAAAVQGGNNVLIDVEDVTNKYQRAYLTSSVPIPSNGVRTLDLMSVSGLRSARYRVTVTLYATGVDELSSFKFLQDLDQKDYAFRDEAQTITFVVDITTGDFTLTAEIAAGQEVLTLDTTTGILLERLEYL